jgi:hypothetical protein
VFVFRYLATLSLKSRKTLMHLELDDAAYDCDSVHVIFVMICLIKLGVYLLF